MSPPTAMKARSVSRDARCGWSRRSGDGQQLVSHTVDIRPRPADRTVRRDFFGTQTESILIETRASQPAHRFPFAGFGFPAGPGPRRAEPGMGERPRRGLRGHQPRSRRRRSATSLRARWCRCSGRSPPMRRRAFRRTAAVLAGAVDLMHRIRTEFKYDPKATVISTPLKEVFEKRHGVCQDFAHVMIAGPARPRTAGGLCQRLSAHHPAAGQAAPARRRRDPRLGLAVVRRRDRLGRLRSDQ